MKEYGFDSIVKEYCGFPKFLSLPCHMEHGWTKLSEPLPTDLRTKKKLMLVFSKRRAEVWKKHSKIRVEIIGAPFVLYRQMNDIRKNKNATGTIVFPAHSCKNLEVIYDVNKLCNDLEQLDSKFHPITICLHPYEYHSQQRQKFEKRGFLVVTAEESVTGSFVENFYRLLSNHKYSASNEMASSLFYAIEMGIPFFLVGDTPQEINDGNEPNTPKSATFFDYDEGRKAYKLFNKPTDKIIQEQRDYVAFEMGLNDQIQPGDLKNLLFLYYFRYEFLADLLTKIKNMVKQFVKKFYVLKNKFQTFSAKVYIRKKGLSVDSKIFTHMTLAERVEIHKLLFKIDKPLTCVEIGSYLGASSTFIANAIGEKSKLYCIDTWGNHFMDYDDGSTDTEERDTFKEFNENISKYKDRIVIIRKWSTEAINPLRADVKKIDFLLIDGNHNYTGVKNDWDLYSPLLKRDSFVALHDTGWAPGVQQVVKEDVILRGKVAIKLNNMDIYKIYK